MEEQFIDYKSLNWDNKFSVRFELENKKELKYIPQNIFSLELPKLDMSDISDSRVDDSLKLTLRSMKGGMIEQEVFDVLCRTTFKVNVSLGNPNINDWIYDGCSVAKIGFATLTDKAKSNPFNLTLDINVTKITYNGGKDPYEFGMDFNEAIQQELKDLKC